MKAGEVDVQEGENQAQYQKAGPPQPKSPVPFFCMLMLVFDIVCIFLAGFQYNTADQRWAKQSHYGVMGVLEITQVIFTFVVGVLGILLGRNPKMFIPVK